MNKPEAYYALLAATNGLEIDLVRLRSEVEALDPIATMSVRFRLAGIEGILEFMKNEVKKYE